MMETLVADEALLGLTPHIAFETGVVGLGVKSALAQARGQAFGLLAGGTVDDSRLSLVLLQQSPKGIEAVALFWQDAIAEVGAIETGDVLLRLAQMQLIDDVASHSLGRRGRQRQKGHAGQAAT